MADQKDTVSANLRRFVANKKTGAKAAATILKLKRFGGRNLSKSEVTFLQARVRQG